MKSVEHRGGPLHLSPAGVQSFLQYGGLLMLYREHCPYCEEVHVPGREGTTLAKVADRVHAEHPGARFVCVCNGPLHREALPPTVASHIETYPTFVVKNGDVITKYTGPRDEKSLYEKAVEGVPAEPADTARAERVEDTEGRILADQLHGAFLANVYEVRHFFTRSTGVVLLSANNSGKIVDFMEAWRDSERGPELAAAAVAIADKDTIFPSLHAKLRKALGANGYVLVATVGLGVHGFDEDDISVVDKAIKILSPP